MAIRKGTGWYEPRPTTHICDGDAHGSFSGAARALSLSQPAVSRRIRSLEQEVGAELFDRSGSAVIPNRKGFAFLTFAEGVLREYSLLQQSIGDQEPIRGTLRIVASTTPGEHLLPDLIARWRNFYPELVATLHVADSAAVEECVAMGHCDRAFLGHAPRRTHLAQWPVAEDEIVLAVPQRHPFSHRTTVTLQELEGQSFVERQAGSGTRAFVEELLRAHGEAMPVHRTIMEMPNAQAQLSATALISTLHASGVQKVVIGDVRDIRQNLDYGRKANQKLHQMLHGATRHLLTYKAARLEMATDLQNEAYTSQTCPACRRRHKPSGREYRCACGFRYHRDGVGSWNIRQKYLGSGPVVGAMVSPSGVRYHPHMRCSSAFIG